MPTRPVPTCRSAARVNFSPLLTHVALVSVWPIAMSFLSAMPLVTAALAQDATPARLDPCPDGGFSVVVIPDTQAYVGGPTEESTPASTTSTPVTNPIFQAHVDWVIANLDSQKIAFVSHVGDIVDLNIPQQWGVARDCMDRLHGKVPYGISVGNHDMTTDGDSSLFQKHFPASRFESFDWYGGHFEGSPLGPQVSGNNANSFQLFSAGGLDFVFLHLECNAPDDVVAWANGVLDEFDDRLALITCHMGWGPRVKPTRPEGFVTDEKGRMTWSKIHGPRANTPQQLWDKCYRRHPNLIAVFSGDQSRTQAYKAVSIGDHGNPVHEFMQDYGVGFLRLYRFTPTPDKLQVQAITLHSGTGDLCRGVPRVPDPAQHQFTFELPIPALANSR